VSSRCVIHVCLLSSVNACVVGFGATILSKQNKHAKKNTEESNCYYVIPELRDMYKHL